MLFAARDRPGGRILTAGENGQPSDDGFDLGPSWFWSGMQPPIGDLVAGKTCVGCLVKGIKDSQERELLIYNVADRRQAFEEIGNQGICYMAGVPAVAAARLMATGRWDVGRMANVEELPPRPFLGLLGKLGLSTHISENGDDRELFP